MDSTQRALLIRSHESCCSDPSAHYRSSRRVEECFYIAYNGDYMILSERDMRFHEDSAH
jgi:hypothetical protein